jgi:hypothetical protein
MWHICCRTLTTAARGLRPPGELRSFVAVTGLHAHGKPALHPQLFQPIDAAASPGWDPVRIHGVLPSGPAAVRIASDVAAMAPPLAPSQARTPRLVWLQRTLAG